VRFEALIGVWEIYVFWNLRPCTLVEIYQHFRKNVKTPSSGYLEQKIMSM